MVAETRLAQIPVIFYAGLFVATDGMYNLFEAEILKYSAEFSPGEYRSLRRRSLLAFALFVAASGLAGIDNWLGFGRAKTPTFRARL